MSKTVTITITEDQATILANFLGKQLMVNLTTNGVLLIYELHRNLRYIETTYLTPLTRIGAAIIPPINLTEITK